MLIFFSVLFEHGLLGLKATEFLQMEREMHTVGNVRNIFTNRNFIFPPNIGYK